MNQTLNNQLLFNNRHEFVYSSSSNIRNRFIKNILDNNPFKKEDNNNIAVLVEDLGFEKNDECKDLNNVALSIFSKDYLNLSIAYEVIDQIEKQIGFEEIESKSCRFLDEIREYSLGINNDHEIDLKDLKKLVLETKEKYFMEYKRYIETKELRNFIEELPLKYLDVEDILESLREIINIDYRLSILISPKKEYIIQTYQAVNSLINSNYQNNYYVKVICDKNKWESYYDLNGTFIKNIDDYDTLSLGKIKKLDLI
ncbi:MAG TPA: hypothetical protein PLV83_04235 [Bacilli bacterium]|nr:hypothetical protein [Bacilli bacterium]